MCKPAFAGFSCTGLAVRKPDYGPSSVKRILTGGGVPGAPTLPLCARWLACVASVHAVSHLHRAGGRRAPRAALARGSSSPSSPMSAPALARSGSRESALPASQRRPGHSPVATEAPWYGRTSGRMTAARRLRLVHSRSGSPFAGAVGWHLMQRNP